NVRWYRAADQSPRGAATGRTTGISRNINSLGQEAEYRLVRIVGRIPPRRTPSASPAIRPTASSVNGQNRRTTNRTAKPDCETASAIGCFERRRRYRRPLLLQIAGFQHAQVGQIAVQVLIIQPIPDNELVGYFKGD